MILFMLKPQYVLLYLAWFFSLSYGGISCKRGLSQNDTDVMLTWRGSHLMALFLKIH